MTSIYIRNIIFGIADSLVSTVGLLSGIATSGTPRATIILTGVVYAFVEAFSMAVGSFLSEQSTQQFEAKAKTSQTQSLRGAGVMFLSFVAASFIPITPYLMSSIASALWISIGLSIATLFILGIAVAKLSRIRLVQNGLQMAMLGGVAILIGVFVGTIMKAA